MIKRKFNYTDVEVLDKVYSTMGDMYDNVELPEIIKEALVDALIAIGIAKKYAHKL